MRRKRAVGAFRTRKNTVIKTVSFRSSIQVANFQHAHVEATADVSPGQNPSHVLGDLQDFVADELVKAKGGVPKPPPRDETPFVERLRLHRSWRP